MTINLRRSDFEGMHPKAKLFGFDEDKKIYVGDGSESINVQWTTWCACIGMLHLEANGFVVVPIDDLARTAQNIRELNNGEYYSEEIEENVCTIEAMLAAQEPK